LEKVNVISKNNKWAIGMTKKEAEILVKEGVACSPPKQTNVFKLLYTEKELKELILERDNRECRKCNHQSHEIEMLIKNEDGGKKTIVNLICLCTRCKEEQKVNEKDIEKMRRENQHLLEHGTEKEYCERCKKTSIFHKKVPFCRQCFDSDESLLCTYSSNGELMGYMKKDEVRKLIKKDEALQKDANSLIIIEKNTERKCVLCNEIKKKGMIKNKICKSCLIKKSKEGVVEIHDRNGKKIATISTVRAKKLAEDGVATYQGKGRMKLERKIDTLIFKIKQTDKKYIVVSRSGKWSMEATRKEKNDLLSENIAEIVHERIIRMTINIEEFKENIIKRDKRKCVYCGKKAHGVFSMNKIKTYSNSVCACIECEYELEPKKFLKWLNVTEKRESLLFKFWKKNNEGGIWLYESSGKIKYKIKLEIGTRLVDEGMAEEYGKGKIKLKYNAYTFREFVVEREKKRCHYCGKKGKTVDHVIPKSKGGLTSPKNCVCACERCNTKKGNSDKKIFMNYIQQKK